MVRSKTVEDLVENGDENTQMVNDSKGTPKVKTRGQAAKSKGRGRGSRPTSPNAPGAPDSEEEISLRDIPVNAGPAVLEGAVGGTDSAQEDFEDVGLNLDEDLEPGIGALDENELDEVIRQAEQEEKRLKQKKRLADLRRNNLKLKLDINNVNSAINKDLARRQSVNNLPSAVVASGRRHHSVAGEVAARGRGRGEDVFAAADAAASAAVAPARRLSRSRPLTQAVADLDELPTLHQYQEEVPEIPSLRTLRSRQDLVRLADQRVEEEDLWANHQQHLPAGNPVVNEPNNSQSTSLTSGRSAKVETGVIRPVVWPHTRLAGRIANPSFDRLDLENLIIGELGIIEDQTISDLERRARISQIKRLLQFSRNYSVDQLREFHAAFLSTVERTGLWNVDVGELASQVLFLAPRPQQVAQVGRIQQQEAGRRQRNRGSSRRFFCSAFNRNSCPHTGTHRQVLGGRNRWVEHFCAHCYLHFGEVAAHSEQDCTRPTARGNQGPNTHSAPHNRDSHTG